MGGVLTVASILNSALFARHRSLNKRTAADEHVSGKPM